MCFEKAAQKLNRLRKFEAAPALRLFLLGNENIFKTVRNSGLKNVFEIVSN